MPIHRFAGGGPADGRGARWRHARQPTPPDTAWGDRRSRWPASSPTSTSASPAATSRVTSAPPFGCQAHARRLRTLMDRAGAARGRAAELAPVRAVGPGGQRIGRRGRRLQARSARRSGEQLPSRGGGASAGHARQRRSPRQRAGRRGRTAPGACGAAPGPGGAARPPRPSRASARASSLVPKLAKSSGEGCAHTALTAPRRLVVPTGARARLQQHSRGWRRPAARGGALSARWQPSTPPCVAVERAMVEGRGAGRGVGAAARAPGVAGPSSVVNSAASAGCASGPCHQRSPSPACRQLARVGGRS
jgi:hypothetical protein